MASVRIMRSVAASLVFVLVLVAGPGALATVIQYTDRASWSGAVGTPTGIDTFNGFFSDSQFRT